MADTVHNIIRGFILHPHIGIKPIQVFDTIAGFVKLVPSSGYQQGDTQEGYSLTGNSSNTFSGYTLAVSLAPNRLTATLRFAVLAFASALLRRTPRSSDDETASVLLERFYADLYQH